MTGNGIRGTAYVLHFLVALVAGALPFLGWLQNAELMHHSSVQALMMMLILGFWLPALILALVALVFSFLPRPLDPPLLLLDGLLLSICSAVFFGFGEREIDFIVGLYVLAPLAFGIRWLVKRRTSRAAR